MAQAERDLGTTLDWVGIDHWNTDNPYSHVIVRGRSDDGRDLVIARDYISQDLRAPPIWRPSSSAPEPISRR
jgi:type IV secretory pathway VirD2 relaxase